MTTPYFNRRVALDRHQAGMSLVIVLIMLVIIGLTSAAAIRNATSGEQATNNIRMQSLAQQYADAALRYCESMVQLDDATRTANTLKNLNIFNDDPANAGLALNANYPPQGWSQAGTWTTANVGAYKSKTLIPLNALKTGESASWPTTLPQCVAERSRMPDGSQATTITARGFSPDYQNDGVATEKTTHGSVVWLQSTILLN